MTPPFSGTRSGPSTAPSRVPRTPGTHTRRSRSSRPRCAIPCATNACSWPAHTTPGATPAAGPVRHRNVTPAPPDLPRGLRPRLSPIPLTRHELRLDSSLQTRRGWTESPPAQSGGSGRGAGGWPRRLEAACGAPAAPGAVDECSSPHSGPERGHSCRPGHPDPTPNRVRQVHFPVTPGRFRPKPAMLRRTATARWVGGSPRSRTHRDPAHGRTARCPC
jgi:hypothetical protein